jgi:hypothetical protein
MESWPSFLPTLNRGFHRAAIVSDYASVAAITVDTEDTLLVFVRHPQFDANVGVRRVLHRGDGAANHWHFLARYFVGGREVAVPTYVRHWDFVPRCQPRGPRSGTPAAKTSRTRSLSASIQTTGASQAISPRSAASREKQRREIRSASPKAGRRALRR